MLMQFTWNDRNGQNLFNDKIQLWSKMLQTVQEWPVAVKKEKKNLNVLILQQGNK